MLPLLTLTIILLDFTKYTVEQTFPTFYDTVIQQRNYTKEISPFDITHKPMYINVSVPFQILVSIKENEQLASWIARVQLEWLDPRLAYDSVAMNLSSVMIPSNLLWIPSFSVFNCVELKFQEKEADSNIAEVFPDGRVTLLIRGYYETICTCDVSNFPFDTQRCSLDFDSNTAVKEFIVLNGIPYDMATGFFMGTPEWTYVDQHVRNSWYGDEKRNFSTTYADAILKRNSTFYIFVFVMPTIMITVCGLASLLLPLEMACGEKMNVALASYLGLLFMLSVIVTEIPRSTTFPLLGRWLMIQLLLCFIALCFEPLLRVVMKILKIGCCSRKGSACVLRETLDVAVFILFMVVDALITYAMFCSSYEYVPPEEYPIV